MNELLPLLVQYNSLATVEEQNEMLKNLNELLESDPEISLKYLIEIISSNCENKILSLALVLARSRIPKNLPFPFNEENNPLLKFNGDDVIELFNTLLNCFNNVAIRDQAIYTFAKYAIVHEAFFDDSEVIQTLINQSNANLLVNDAISKILFQIVDEVTVSEEKTLAILEFIKSCFCIDVTVETTQFCIDTLRVLVKFLPQEFCDEIRPFILEYTVNENFSTKCCQLWSQVITCGSFLFTGDRDILVQIMEILTCEGHSMLAQCNALHVIHSYYKFLKRYEDNPSFDEFTYQVLNMALDIINKITNVENDEENIFLIAQFVIIAIFDNFSDDILEMLLEWAEENENSAASLQVFGAISHASEDLINQFEVVENYITSEDPFVISKLMEFIDDNSYYFEREESDAIIECVNQFILHEDNIVAENAQRAAIALFNNISIEAANRSILFYLESIDEEEIPCHSYEYIINCMTSILTNRSFISLSMIFLEGEVPIIQQLFELFNIESNEIMSLCTLLSQIAINTRENFECLIDYSIDKMIEVINHNNTTYGIDALAKICVSVPISQDLLSQSLDVIVGVISGEPTCDELFYAFKAVSLICQKFGLPEETAEICTQATFNALSNEYFNFEYKEAAFDLLSKMYSKGLIQSEETIEKMKHFMFTAISNVIDLFNQDNESTAEMVIYIIELLILLLQKQQAAIDDAIPLLEQVHSFDSEAFEDSPKLFIHIGILIKYIAETFKEKAAFLTNYTDVIELLAQSPETASLSYKISASIEAIGE